MSKLVIPNGYVLKAFLIRLEPNNKQETMLYKTTCTSRWAYNWALNKKKDYYEKTKKTLSGGDIRKELTQLKKTDEYKWVSEFSNNVTKQAIKDCDTTFSNFFKGKADFPKFKSKKKNKWSFFCDGNKTKYLGSHIQIEKIGKIRLSEKDSLSFEDDKCRITSARVSKRGNNWFISINTIIKDRATYSIPTNNGVGVDVGIKDLAIVSDGTVFKNINKSKTVRKLEKRLKRLQRKVSRKYNINKIKKGESVSFIKTNNIKRLEKEIQSIRDRLNNIRRNYLHQTTNSIVKQKPSYITIEDLNIKGMMKNKHLSKAVQQQSLYEFRRQLAYKSKWNNIELRVVDRWFPSSKTCSECGYIKSDLKLKDRVYICPCCGLKIDRDYNASINLANAEIYEISL